MGITYSSLKKDLDVYLKSCIGNVVDDKLLFRLIKNVCMFLEYSSKEKIIEAEKFLLDLSEAICVAPSTHSEYMQFIRKKFGDAVLEAYR